MFLSPKNLCSMRQNLQETLSWKVECFWISKFKDLRKCKSTRSVMIEQSQDSTWGPIITFIAFQQQQNVTQRKIYFSTKAETKLPNTTSSDGMWFWQNPQSAATEKLKQFTMLLSNAFSIVVWVDALLLRMKTLFPRSCHKQVQKCFHLRKLTLTIFLPTTFIK